jgi:putative ABC transport system permease protein
VGFIALIIGCMGVASAVNVYIKEKVNSIAVLRCLGVTSYQAFAVYFIQIMMEALLGAILDGLLGIGIQQLRPAVLKIFLPVNVSTAVSWKAVGQGIVIGLIMAILFTFLPLMAIRKISPLLAVRMDFEAKTKQSGSANSIIYVLIALFIWAFARIQMKNTVQAVQFTIGISVALLLLL